MKILKKIIYVILIMLLILTAIFALGRYGWKVLGFSACEGAGIQSVEVGESNVKIKGFYPGSFPEGFCGYYAEEQNGKLYVGFNFSAVFGMFETGDFDVNIPVKGKIQEVILKTKLMENTIWTEENGDATAMDLYGVYVKLECGDVSTIVLRGGSGENIKAQRIDVLSKEKGELIFMGETLAQLSKEENRSIQFNISAIAYDNTILAEDEFSYNIAQERLYVTIAEDGMTCSTNN